LERIVTRGGAEGLVVHALHACDGSTFKVKPEISIDAAVIGYAGTGHDVLKLMLALVTPTGHYRTVGRVRTGWDRHESKELSTRLTTPEPQRLLLAG
jgi:ATP-dependent DNA ligase